MKKILVLGTVLSSMLFLGACKSNEKDVTPATVTQQLYPSPTVKISLNIQVLASSQAARTSGLDGATVTVKQNGNTYSAVTDESGIVTFGGLTEGQVSWFVKKSGFASVNGSKYLEYTGTPNVSGVNGNNGTGSVTVNNEQHSSDVANVTLQRIGATVKFKFYGNFDFSTGTNTGNDVLPSTAKVLLRLSDETLQPNVYTGTIEGDGTVSFTNLPENVQYNLELYHVTTKPGTNGGLSENVTWSISGSTRTTPAADQIRDLGNLFAGNNN